MKNYVSNHFVWHNDFGKIRRFRAGGRLNIPHTSTFIDVGFETLDNYIYFDNQGLPTRADGNIQVFSATLRQNLAFRALHWDNTVTYQTSSNSTAIPLPKLAVYSNLYLNFKIAKVLSVQLGMDCNYYTRYRAMAYNPATMTFHAQDEVEVGNYPYMNAYATFKLSKTRFFVMMSHINQGWFSKDYFSLAHYPLNPSKFQLGLSVDFAH